jgi:hypothetical protein
MSERALLLIMVAALLVAVVMLCFCARWAYRMHRHSMAANARNQTSKEKIDASSGSLNVIRISRVIFYPTLLATALSMVGKLAAAILLPLFLELMNLPPASLLAAQPGERGVSITWSMRAELRVEADRDYHAR